MNSLNPHSNSIKLGYLHFAHEEIEASGPRLCRQQMVQSQMISKACVFKHHAIKGQTRGQYPKGKSFNEKSREGDFRE